MARVLDLSHPITEDMPVYPGCIPPTIQVSARVEVEGYAERRLTIYTHTGTHIDAPAHMLAGASTLDRMDVDRFVGPAVALDVSGMEHIGRRFLEAQAARLEGCDFVLFHSGWDRHWGTAAYFDGFPVLDEGGVGWLACCGLKGVGFDAISADPVGATDFRNHFALFRAGMISLENLTGLAPLVGRRFTLACLPLRLAGADGSPVRAVALLED